jgi:hypothetical protein
VGSVAAAVGGLEELEFLWGVEAVELRLRFLWALELF